MEDHERRVNDVEVILFKKDEEERMGLFDSIYKKITENEKARLVEEEKLRDEIAFIRNEVNNNTFSTQNVVKNFRNLEEQNLRMNNELQEFNSRILKWQEQFLDKYSRQYNDLMGEISEMREKELDLRNMLHAKGNEIRWMTGMVKKSEETEKVHYEWVQKLQDEINEVSRTKCDTTDFLSEIQKMEMNFRQLKIDTDNHGNHFAMVENFVEKYIPIRIQSTISEALNNILPYKDRSRYAEFDKKKFAELH